MAKAILDVDIKDEAFKKFLELFNKFKEDSDKLPGRFKQLGDNVGETGLKFGDIAIALAASATLSHQMSHDVEEQAKDTKRQESSWKHIAGFTKQTAGHVASITKTLLRWTSITTAIGGLAGIGSLFGLEHLANNVAQGRRTALGFGSTYGQQKAFGLDFGRFVDPQQFLGGVNQALHDVNHRIALLSLGVPGNLLQSNNAALVGADLIGRLKTLADTTNPIMYQQAIDYHRLGGVASVDILERFHNMSRQEVTGQQQKFGTDARVLNLSRKTQYDFQQFDTQLHRAGQTIENALVQGLGHLTGPLTKLSDAVATAIGTIIGSIKPSDWNAIAKGIEGVADYVAKPQFRTDLKNFVNDVEYAAHKMVDALRWLGLIPSHQADVSKTFDKSTKLAPIPKKTTLIEGGHIFGLGAASDMLGSLFGNKISLTRGGPAVSDSLLGDKQTFHLVSNNDSRGVRLAAISALEQAHHIPAGLLASVYGNESSFGSRLFGGKWWEQNKQGALGPFQLLASTAPGIDRNNFAQSSSFAAAYLSSLLSHYKGDTAKALAAYDYGQGNLDKDIEAHGSDWMQHLPKETSDYLRKAGVAVSTIATTQASTNRSIDRLAATVKKAVSPSKTTVHLQTNPGSSSIIIGNQAAAQN